MHIARHFKLVTHVDDENALDVNLYRLGTYSSCNFVPFRKEGNVSYNCPSDIIQIAMINERTLFSYDTRLITV